MVYVRVDDGYQGHGLRLWQGKRGANLPCSDSEVITLLLWMAFQDPGKPVYVLPVWPAAIWGVCWGAQEQPDSGATGLSSAFSQLGAWMT